MTDRIATNDDIARELAALLRLDPALGPVAEAAGPIPLRLRAGGLKGLCAIIVSQQVSKASADAIFARLETHADLDDPSAVLALQDENYRAAGVSRPKQRTLTGLAEAASDGRLNFERLALAGSQEAVSELVQMKGVGVWTAECYLLFCIGHPDIFPAGDLALQIAVAGALRLDDRPKEKALGDIASRWAPHRSVAARLFWSYYPVLTNREAVPAGG